MNQLSPFRIDSTEVRQDVHGRFCLNDLHRASGGEGRHQPSNFLRLDTTQDLMRAIRSSDLRNDPITVLQGGSIQGTYVCRELVYAYAMWVSPAFHLKVIRTFDALVTGPQQGYQVPLTTYVSALERVVELQQQLLQARPVSVSGVQPRPAGWTNPARPRESSPPAEHPWESRVRAWLERNPEYSEVSTTQLLLEAVRIEEPTHVQRSAVGRVMSSLGWRRERRRPSLQWVYVRPGVAV